MADQHHWYHPQTLDLVEQVPNAKGDKMVKPDIRHARKLGLLCSITSIEKDVYGLSRGLLDYKENCMATAAVANAPAAEDYEEDGTLKREYLDRIRGIAGEMAAEAREKGNEIHSWIAAFLERAVMPTQPIGIDIVNRVSEMLLFIDAKDISCECAMGGLEFGFAGTPDRYIGSANLAKMQEFCGAEITFAPDVRGEIIVDTKSREWDRKPEMYPSQERQLGGYGVLRNIGTESLFVSEFVHRETGEVLWTVFDDVADWMRIFEDTFFQWCKQKAYWPREVAVASRGR